MPDSQTGPSGGKPAKRSLPSWRQNESSKKPAGSGEHEDIGEGKGTKIVVAKGNGRSESNSSSTNFSKLLEGVVFVLSGFVNPERGLLRSQALEMGAEYQPDWNSDCTLLVCAFPNTPKFRQVEADNGTIVSKDWISECYSQKKLVDIDVYLIHAGKPWRRSNLSDTVSQEQETTPGKNSMKKVETGSHSRKSTSSAVSSKTIHSDRSGDLPSPSKVKNWAMIDLLKTISWLESQDEKPEADEIKKIAAEGILTCLQDAIDALEQNKGVQWMSEQWNILPQAVEELTKHEASKNPQSSVSRKNLCKWTSECKQMYEAEYRRNSEGAASSQPRKPKTESKGERSKAEYYDSDETIEMTEEEIDVAFNRVASKVAEF